MTFEQCVAFVLAEEGQLSRDPLDPGGITKFGISLRFYRTEIYPYATDTDILQLTKERAVAIYKDYFWEPLRCSKLPVGLDLLVFECAINQGRGTAAKLLQRDLGVTADGIIGPITLAAANDYLDIEELLVNYFARRAKRYAETANVAHFGRGWYKRLGKALLLSGQTATRAMFGPL
jgi:lysozyme family protein